MPMSDHLPFRQLGKRSILVDECGVSSVLDNPAAFHDVDPIRMLDCAETVGDNDACCIQPGQTVADDRLRAVVESASRFVEEQHAGPVDDGTCN